MINRCGWRTIRAFGLRSMTNYLRAVLFCSSCETSGISERLQVNHTNHISIWQACSLQPFCFSSRREAAAMGMMGIMAVGKRALGLDLGHCSRETTKALKT
ncbi:hypothetical protein CDEST_15079 [Colletotrichum destructivum]|uniref:Secreted protein n=1 Tax=Colletotrichum destructivum TaxID=34406 RepID=A0AAX4J401_9PEZI|nr:hypothetical protein CDEST_15079 [Colletotrichum destructivum]